MTKSLTLLAGGVVLFWAVIAWPARWLGGDAALHLSAVAAVLCFVPMALTFVWACRAFHGRPEQQVAAVLGGTGIRMAAVIAGGMVLYFTVPSLHQDQFWLWVIVFYLFTLALEISLLIRRPAVKEPRNS